MLSRIEIEKLHNANTPINDSCVLIKNSLNGRIFQHHGLISKSFFLKREEFSLDNEMQARHFFPRLTVPLEDVWSSDGFGFIVYKKVHNIYNGHWRFWNWFLKKHIQRKLLYLPLKREEKCVDWVDNALLKYRISRLEDSEIKTTVTKILDILTKSFTSKTLYTTFCHGDLTGNNLLITPKLKLILIDWTNGGSCPIFYDQIVPYLYGSNKSIFKNKKLIDDIRNMNKKEFMCTSQAQIQTQIICSVIHFALYNAYRHDTQDADTTSEGLSILKQIMGMI
jgi:hypothetical protein